MHSYKEMSQVEVEKAFNTMASIPDAMGWLKQNRERSQAIQAKLNVLKDISYGYQEPQKLDIYLPKNPSDAPVFIDIHGGGWFAGTKDARAIPAETLVSRGAIWVSIDYGLAPDFRIEQIIDHVGQAISWVHHNIAQYGGDPNKLFIYGHSAGGHLAATPLMPGWYDRYNIPQGAIKGVLPASGVYDLESQFYAHNPSQQALKMSLEEAHRFSPMHHIADYKVPVILSYGDIEPEGFIKEAKDYAQVLRSCGFAVQLIKIPGENHFETMNELTRTQNNLFKAVFSLITRDV